MKFNLISLLDASGELRPSARKKLLKIASQDPMVNAQYEAAHANFDVFGSLPIPEPSAVERQEIPATIKGAIHAELQQQEKRAVRWRLLRRWAAGSMALAACAVFAATLLHVNHSQEAGQQAQVARINAMIDRMALPAQPMAASDDLADNGAPTGSPVLTSVRTTEMINQVNALTAASARSEAVSDPSAPPGSF